MRKVTDDIIYCLTPAQPDPSLRWSFHRTNERETNRRVIALFQEHPELIEGYAAFMPPGNTVNIPADPHGNIILTMPTGVMEIARDGTVVNETYIQTPEPQGEETKLPEKEKRLLQTLRDQIVDTQEQEEYNTLITLFGTNLTISPEQRKVRVVLRSYPRPSYLSSGQGFTGCWPASRISGEAPRTSRE